jgi:hypothetical protein
MDDWQSHLEYKYINKSCNDRNENVAIPGGALQDGDHSSVSAMSVAHTAEVKEVLLELT